jgi:hypothetical protein
MKKIQIIILLISFGLLSSLSASVFPKAGTTAAPFLKIGAGARAVALGGNFTGLANDASALYWNPAGITNLESISFSVTHSNWFAGISHDYLAFTTPVGSAGALGVEVIYLASGDIEQTTLQEQDGTGIFYDASDIAFGMTYARELTDRFSVAMKAKFIRQTIYSEEASTMAVDFGTMYRTDFHGLTIGMNLANFGGSLQMLGNDLSVVSEDPISGEQTETVFNTESWPLPIVFRVGIAMDVAGPEHSFFPMSGNRVTLVMDGAHPNDNYETFGAGVEYEWNDLLALRGGYRANHDTENLSLGGGLNLILAGLHVSLDYAWADMGDLDAVQRFTAAISF